MSAATLSLGNESKQLAMDLKELLDDLDPARWRDDREAALRARLQELQTRAHELKEAYAQSADQRLDALRAKFGQIEESLRNHAPEVNPSTSLRDAWMRFRQAVEPEYESLVASLRANNVNVPNLRPSNYARNFFHVGMAFMCILIVQGIVAWTQSFIPIIVIACSFALMGWSMEIGRRISPTINRFLMWVFSPVAHPHEAHHINSSTWYTSALALLSLTQAPIVCSVALAVLGLGDPMAALIGKRWGKIRFPNGRSLEGTLAFILFGGGAALGALALFHPELSLMNMIILSLVGATAGGLTEQLVSRVDDNLSIPVAAGAATWLCAFLLSISV